ncbi:MAG: phosphoribosylanthranilate isomerase [Prevotella sp.]|nr:phosphoribosylanthranilate isomerase [Prevotella sp.]
MIVKVCGMREAENIRAVEALGVDWMGFIFWEHSSRCVSQRPAYLPTRAKRVGVFVDAPLDVVCQHVETFGLDVVQLHGSESPAYLHNLRNALAGAVLIVKAFSIATRDDLLQTSLYEGLADFFLFDTKAQLVGGNGRKFDWTVLAHYVGSTPFLLSGGIGPDDASRLSAFSHPRLAGIDLNSRFEISPALKNVELLKQFLYDIQQNQ